MSETSQPPIRRVRERLEYQNPWVRVHFDDVEGPNGPSRYTRIEDGVSGAGPGVVVIPRDAIHRILLVHIYRYPVGKWLWELPRGFGDPGESTLQSAARELAEEVGLQAEAYTEIGTLYPNTGLLASSVVAVVADRVEGKVTLQRSEAIDDFRWLALRDALTQESPGLLGDGISLAALSLLMGHEGVP